MTLAERQLAAETTRRAFPGIVLNNISTCCLQDALTLLNHSQQTIFTNNVSSISPMLMIVVNLGLWIRLLEITLIGYGIRPNNSQSMNSQLSLWMASCSCKLTSRRFPPDFKRQVFAVLPTRV